MESEYYVQMCRTLRVLNAVRHPAVGIPLTYTQYPFVFRIDIHLVQKFLIFFCDD